MKDDVKAADINKIERLSALIASLPESELEKLSYIVEDIKLAIAQKYSNYTSRVFYKIKIWR